MIALKNHLFALGGLTPQGYTHSVERYDLTTNEWEWAAPLSEPRYRHAACVTSRGKVNDQFCHFQFTFTVNFRFCYRVVSHANAKMESKTSMSIIPTLTSG